MVEKGEADFFNSRAAFLAALTLIAATSAIPAELHNFVVLIPYSLPTASVDHASAPTLARLRAEGVYFAESYTAFPAQSSAWRLSTRGASDVFTVLARSASTSYSVMQVDGPADVAFERTITQLSGNDRPFLLIYRTHAEGGAAPGLFATLADSDEALSVLEERLKRLHIYDNTNIIVSAEHGHGLVWKDSNRSTSNAYKYKGVSHGKLPPGFLAVDLVAALQESEAALSLFDPDDEGKLVDWSDGQHPNRGNAIIAVTPSDPRVIIEAQGGHDLIFLPDRPSRAEIQLLGRHIVKALFAQNYSSGVFVNEQRLGKIKGALSTREIGLKGGIGTDEPDIVVSFVSMSADCDRPILCTVLISDTPLEELHDVVGVFSRADTWGFMAARGPDFKRRMTSRTPASNADVVRTIAELMQLAPAQKHEIGGRVLSESLSGYRGDMGRAGRERVIAAKPSDEGFVTEVRLLRVDGVDYYGAGGSPGWTVGVPQRPELLE